MKINLLFGMCALLCAPGHASAQSSLTFCETGVWNDDACISPCATVNITALPNSTVGFCTGQATTYRKIIYRIQLGDQDGNTCEIFNGSLSYDAGNASPGITIGRGSLDFKKCKNRTTYDRILLTTSRKAEYAGFTSYPDGSGKIARTTSYCASDSLSGSIDDLSWLDTMSGGAYQNSSACYVRETNTWGTAYKKAGAAPSTQDFTGESNVLMIQDDLKQIFLNSLSGPPYVRPGSTPTTLDGYYLERSGSSDSVSYKADPSDSNKIITLIKESSGLVRLGTLDKAKQQKLTISFHSTTRSTSAQQYGLRFYFRRNGTNAEFIGTNTSDDGLFISLDQF
jgi:hypothetical protein